MRRDNGLMRGKGGSMHLTSVEHGVMGSYAIIGAHLPIACGAAWRAQYKGQSDVSVCFFGDGTTNIGAFHEALNFAAIWKLPVVFVCENNLYMEYTADRRGPARRAPGRRPCLGLRAASASSSTATTPMWSIAPRSAAYAKARGGEGPSLIECMTYRYAAIRAPIRPNTGPQASSNRWKERDPIKIYRDGSRVSACADVARSIDIESEVRRRRRSNRGLQGGAAAAGRYSDDRRLRRWRLRMAELTYRDAVARGIAQEMARDPDVVFLGEDIAKAGGVFKATVGLFDQFGPMRVRDTPISEQAILGAAMGAAMTGLASRSPKSCSRTSSPCASTISPTSFPRAAT